MVKKRFIVEIGTGIDMHGGDVTNAAKKAIKNAISHACLCGLTDIMGITDTNQIHIDLKIACPYPDKLDREELKKAVPLGSVDLEVVTGGLTVRGLSVPQLGEGNTIVAVVAALTVYVETGAAATGA